jgi:signal transduction histidine kinase
MNPREPLAPVDAEPVVPMPSHAHAPDTDISRYHGRLFRKYLLLMLTLVSVTLLASSAIGLYFSYEETRAALADLQHEKAVGAAARIEQYIDQVTRQLSLAALPQLDAGDHELRRIELIKLLRQQQEVTDAAWLDAAGREQVSVSRLALESVGSGRDRSAEPAFTAPRRDQPWYGPVYFRKETEPYLTVAVRGGDKGPVTVAELNLKFIWDVISRIQVGREGKAYVVDAQGYLVADPDIGLVLRKTSLAALPHVAAPTAAGAVQSVNLAGRRVLTAAAPIESLQWRVFAEQPVSEVYHRLDAAIARTVALLAGGLLLSALAAFLLARGMVRPIRVLDAGAQRIGTGELDQRIDVRTGDELQALAEQFNRMSARLAESHAGLERQVDARTAELREALDYQTAISGVLRVMNESPADTMPVFEAILDSGMRLFGSSTVAIFRFDGTKIHLAANRNWTPQVIEHMRKRFPMVPDPGLMSGRVILEARVVVVEDAWTDEHFDRALSRLGGWRRLLGAPLLKDGAPVGAIVVAWNEPGLVPPRQVELVQTFADQAVFAIENVRLFHETREALERQTATAEVLKLISRSVFDLDAVLKTLLDSACRLCGAEGAVLFRPGPDGAYLPAAYQLWQREPDSQARYIARLHERPIRAGRDSVAGRALLQRAAVCVQDVQDDAEYERKDLVEIGAFRNVLAVPLLREGEPIGVIAMSNSIGGRPFTDVQIALAQTFADQAVIAIENVRLFHETREALERQTASAQVISMMSRSGFDLESVLDTLIRNACRLCQAVRGLVLVGQSAGEYRLAVHHGATVDDTRHMLWLYRQLSQSNVMVPAHFKLDDGHSSGILQGETRLGPEPLHVPDLQAHQDPDVAQRAREVDLRAMLATPMLLGDSPQGVVVLWRDRPQPFNEAEIGLMQTFADQAVIAIENVRLFHEIEDKNHQLEAANRHKSEFLANMSHELRTPLNAVIGFSEVLLERLFGELNDKQDEYLKDIHSSGQHLLSLINDVLDLSKIEAGRMELDLTRFDLGLLLEHSLTLVRERAARQGLALSLEVSAGLEEWVADARKVKQVVVNLVSNAVKFTPAGGHVSVTATRHGDLAQISVADSGVGIAPEDQAKVFEEFRQASGDYLRKAEGSGLGLALARRFVELHGGEITLDSAPGRGSTFRFTLPLHDTEVP